MESVLTIWAQQATHSHPSSFWGDNVAKGKICGGGGVGVNNIKQFFRCSFTSHKQYSFTIDYENKWVYKKAAAAPGYGNSVTNTNLYYGNFALQEVYMSTSNTVTMSVTVCSSVFQCWLALWFGEAGRLLYVSCDALTNSHFSVYLIMYLFAHLSPCVHEHNKHYQVPLYKYNKNNVDCPK